MVLNRGVYRVSWGCIGFRDIIPESIRIQNGGLLWRCTLDFGGLYQGFRISGVAENMQTTIFSGDLGTSLEFGFIG